MSLELPLNSNSDRDNPHRNRKCIRSIVAPKPVEFCESFVLVFFGFAILSRAQTSQNVVF